MQGLRHLGKKPLQRGLNHHFGEWIEVRIAAHLTRGTLAVGLDVDFQVEFDWSGGLRHQRQHRACRRAVVRRSEQMNGHTAGHFERAGVPFRGEIAHGSSAQQLSKRIPILKIASHQFRRR